MEWLWICGEEWKKMKENHWLYVMVMDLLRRKERYVGKPLVVWHGYGSVEKNGERCRKTTGCMAWLWIY